ncbi:MAG: Transcription initiation protein spt3 [Sclerophora amabilis]|nr:MAG: Transcription initiation protein spt3 [Sclerophora amabilis]
MAELENTNTGLPSPQSHSPSGSISPSHPDYHPQSHPHSVSYDDSDLEDDETLEEWKVRFAELIEQMMFVSGEIVEPSAESLYMIEEIVRQQVIEMVRLTRSRYSGCTYAHFRLYKKLTQCTALAARRGARSISTDDLIFLIRHDKAKVSRLRTFLSWKEVRKNVKDSDEKGGGDVGDFGAGEDPAAAAMGQSGQTIDKKQQNKRARVGLPWDVSTFYNEQVPEREDEEDEDEEEMNYATLQRLKIADERTKGMTREEYVHFSECRQASFTFRKAKRFKEWAGFGTVTDSKPNDDIIDVLGFLTFDIVMTLTEEALRIKAAEDSSKRESGGENQERKRKRERGLFDPPEDGRAPVGPKHIEEAFRRLQHRNNKSRAMRNFTSSLNRTSLKLVSHTSLF